jgi:hypothetical protein
MASVCRKVIGGATSIAWVGRKLRAISITSCVIVFAAVADENRGDSLVATMVNGPH